MVILNWVQVQWYYVGRMKIEDDVRNSIKKIEISMFVAQVRGKEMLNVVSKSGLFG